MRRSLAVVAVMVVATVVTACGPPPPGTAAEVEGTRISMDQLDDATTGFCLLVDDPAAPLGAIRSQALSLLLLREAAEIEVERRGITLSAADLQVTSRQRAQLRELAGGSLEEVLSVYETNLYVRTVAEQLADSGEEAAAPGEDPGIRALLDALSELDVEVDPRFPLLIDEADSFDTALAAGEIPTREPGPTQLCG